MEIFQKKVTLKPRSKGFHIITQELMKLIPEISEYSSGIANIIVQHTSCGLTINENADPTVREDFETFFRRLVPENASLFRHTAEGLDDMTSHIKSSIFGVSLNIPISNGNLALGTWQGIYLCEFRDFPKSRNIIVTIIGKQK